MQKIKLITAAYVALTLSTSASAESVPTPLPANTNVSGVEFNAPIQREQSSSTISKLSKKQLELIELELDAKIAEARSKANGMPQLPVIPKIDSQFSAPMTGAGVQVQQQQQPMEVLPVYKAEKPDFEPSLIAVYGKNTNLTADIMYKDAVYSIKQKSGQIDGWIASKISKDTVTLVNGKRTKEIRVQSTGDN